MSIIYDALKKVEDSIDKIPKIKEKEHKPKRKIYLLYVLFACLGFIIANTFFNFISETHQSKINILSEKQSKLKQTQASNIPQAQPKEKNLALKTPVLKTKTPASAPLTTQMQKPAVAVPTSVAIATAIETKKGKNLQDSFILNGVFFSQDKGYALINNKIAEEGDIIDGAKVVRINLDGVELKSRGGLPIKLSNSNK